MPYCVVITQRQNFLFLFCAVFRIKSLESVINTHFPFAQNHPHQLLPPPSQPLTPRTRVVDVKGGTSKCIEGALHTSTP